MVDVRRTTDGRQLDGYTISSPCEPNGSGELKKAKQCFQLQIMVNKQQFGIVNDVSNGF